MASSDDEGEAVPQAVSNYHFVDDKDEPISFAELPFKWEEGGSPDGRGKQIFLHGTTDNGLQKIYKQVVAWKFDFSEAKPHISVLSKENNWIDLQKPRKSFEDTIRTILITVQCLHFLRKNPESSGKALWDHMFKVFSLYESRPSENDLVDHTDFITEAVKRDEVLANSKFLLTFLEKPRKKEAFDEDAGTKFIADDDDMIDEIEEEEGSDEESDLFDSVCAICDNGGDILPCEGRCLRSFHATADAGSDSMCDSLGLSDKQVEAIQNFFCKNCQYKRHQCFSCGKLGSSDKSSGAEVFACVSATCGRFYHPHCVAKLLHREGGPEAEEVQKKIAAGESFTCPVHKCYVCKQGENKMDPELQFAMCRRCPKSYHRKCLPRKIAFEDDEDEGIIQRAWEGLIPNRILIYCLKHEIDDELGTPIRNHIRFPNIGEKKKRPASELLPSKEKVGSRERKLASEDASGKRVAVKPQKGIDRVSSSIKQGDSLKKREGILSGPESSKKQKVTSSSGKLLNKSSSLKSNKFTVDESKGSLGDQLYTYYNKGSESFKSRKGDTAVSEPEQNQTVKTVAKDTSSLVPLDADSKRRILALMKEASSSVTLEEIVKKHKVPTTHVNFSSRNVVDKTITLGKVEGSIEALRAALQKLEAGCSIEDAKAVCEPGLLNQIIKWRNKLRVYLAPFLHGMRYTSFGRHFTKVDKLKEIVDMIRWYFQDGDMLVDFCCGANDFSCLMKKRLDEMGKKCSYKNFDVLQAKNDFNFEKRDWMTVKTKELPAGSQLIMGLNPPFGVNAALANKFINKALEFKPKLIVLIVPQETERLDKKNPPYDLVWEDDELLAGKSFYLPGSVDINDKQIEQWNVCPPPLYLWSRQDWTSKHKAIAHQHGHLSRVRNESHPVEPVSDFPIVDHDEIPTAVDDHPLAIDEPKPPQERAAVVTKSNKDDRDTKTEESLGNNGSGKKQSNVTPKKNRRGGKGKQKKGPSEKSLEENKRSANSSLPNKSGGLPPVESYSPKPVETPSQTDPEKVSYQQVEPKTSGSRSPFGNEYDGTRSDDVARMYNSSNEEPYPRLTYARSNGASLGPDYGAGIDSRGYRPSFMDGVDNSQTRQYVRREADYLSKRSSYLSGPDPIFSTPYAGRNPVYPTPYGSLGSAADSSYNRVSTSAMQRYAPRLDELNHMMVNSMGSEVPSMNRSGAYDPLAPRPGFRSDSLGNAPGPYGGPSYQQQSGWLNE